MTESKLEVNLRLIKSTFKNNDKLNDKLMDKLLGVKSQAIEQKVNYYDLMNQHGAEQYIYEATPYDFIRVFLKVTKPTKDDIVYDLGSGYGQVIIYGALTSDAFFKGIEIVPERAAASIEVKNRLNIKNAEFYCQSVKNYDFSDGTIFFLFNPFCKETLYGVKNKLWNLSKKRKIMSPISVTSNKKCFHCLTLFLSRVYMVL